MKRVKVSIATLLLLLLVVRTEAQDFEKLPVKLIGNTILVKATINEVSGDFILDTGSPGTVLNSQYFYGYESVIEKEFIIDLHGSAYPSKHQKVESAKLGSISLPKGLAWVTDLSNLEKVKGTPIAGILGYSSFKEFELVFDLAKKQIVILPREKYVTADLRQLGIERGDSMSIGLSGHLPYIIAQMDEEPLRLVIDSGSEINILHVQKLRNKEHLFEPTGRLVVHGIGGEPKRRSKGWVRGLSVFGKETEVVLMDISEYNEFRKLKIEGLLGVPFLQTSIISISYPDQKIYFMDRTNEYNADERDVFVRSK